LSDARSPATLAAKQVALPHTAFTAENFAAFCANDRNGPIHMINLVRLRATADYPDSRIATGAKAYAAYGRDTAPIFARMGGQIVWRGELEQMLKQMLIGPADEAWDLCFVAMIKDADYRSAMVHQQAAVLESPLIRTATQSPGDNFGVS
jgi:hypothetical protein